MQVINGNKKFTTFPTMTNMKKHVIDNRDRVPENSNEFLRSLVKSLKIKFLHSMARSMRMLSIKARNLKGLKNDTSTSNHGNFSSRRSSRPEVLYKKAFLSNFKYFTIKHLCRSLFLNKFASLILLIKTLAQVVVCKFCNIFKSTSFVKQIRPAASEHSQNHQVSDTVT